MKTITRIETGFLTGNFGDEIDAPETAAAWHRAIRAKYPGAEVLVNFEDGHGSKPYALKTRIWCDQLPHEREDVISDEIHYLLEGIEPVYKSNS